MGPAGDWNDNRVEDVKPLEEPSSGAVMQFIADFLADSIMELFQNEQKPDERRSEEEQSNEAEEDINLPVLPASVQLQATPFIDQSTGLVGLQNTEGEVCLSAHFGISVVNFNIGETNNRIPFVLTSTETKIGGRCANSSSSGPMLTATITHENRKRKLKFYFGTKTMMVKHVDELRWQLKKMVYEESYDDKSAIFESDNSSAILSAPLNQKYICNDKINVTLHGDDYKDVIVELSPEIDVQPYGPMSNSYLCERTRKRTLKEAFENKATIFSGVVLGLASMGSIIGHSIRKHMTPHRRQIYENLSQPPL